MNEVNQITLAGANSAMAQSVKEGALVLITGTSGVGKGYVAAKVMKVRAKWISLDDYGVEEGKKWIVKIPDDVLRKGKAFFGCSDNMSAVAQQLREVTDMLHVFFVHPTPELFRATQAAKAKDADHLPSEWKKGWSDKSKFSDGKVKAFLAAKEKQLLSHITTGFVDGTVKVFYIFNDGEPSEVVHG